MEKLSAAFIEANDELKRGLEARETLDSTRLSTASKVQQISAQAVEYVKQAAEYARLAKSAREHAAKLLELESTYSKHLITCNDSIYSQRANADALEKHIAEVKALVEQAAQKKRDQAGDVSSDVAAILAYPIKDLPEPTASIKSSSVE